MDCFQTRTRGFFININSALTITLYCARFDCLTKLKYKLFLDQSYCATPVKSLLIQLQIQRERRTCFNECHPKEFKKLCLILSIPPPMIASLTFIL